MATINDQIQNLQNQIASLQSLLLGVRDPGRWYAMVGSAGVFGLKITEGYSATDMIVAMDGTADHVNPDRQASPNRPEEYSNIANIYGEVFLSPDKNVSTLQDTALTVSTAPGTGYHRYDTVYAYVGSGGPAVAIAAGTAVVNASTPTAPTLPHGVLALAQIHVQANVTGIANAVITDLRNFSGRLQGLPPTINGTSTTSLAIGTGSKTFTTQANIAWVVGQQLDAASVGAPANLMSGTITSYTGATLILNVTSTTGAGTYADWAIGLTGLTGLTGPGGPQGMLGPVGPAVFLVAEEGDEGPRGQKGDTGVQGIQGAVGATGPGVYLEAEPGDEGPTGPAGPAGPLGPVGASGPVGPAVFLVADEGEEGPRGQKGDTGNPGPQGLAGATGPAVYLDAEGEEGPQGYIGPTGPKGATGASGPTGPGVFLQAEQGDEGDLGPVGPTGRQGAIGITGATGPAVYLSAEDGEEGLVGPMGLQGPPGVAGGNAPTWVIKSSGYTAVMQDCLAVNTTSAAITITLPASPSSGPSILFCDAAQKFATNALTVARNGNTIGGLAEDLIVATNGASFGMFYSGSTWVVF
ncbi:MAG: hypothetical protein WCJ66_04500 [Verrucomicrobiota bacterium]